MWRSREKSTLHPTVSLRFWPPVRDLKVSLLAGYETWGESQKKKKSDGVGANFVDFLALLFIRECSPHKLP